MLEINKKRYDFKLSYRAIKGFLLESGLVLDDMSDSSKMIMHMPALLYHGIKAGCKANGTKFDLTIDLIEDWLDEDISNAGKAFDKFEQSQPHDVGEQ